MTRSSLALALGTLILQAACDKPRDGTPKAAPSSPSPIAMKDGADGLRATFAAARTACEAKDYAVGKALVLSLIPDATALKKVMKPGAPSDFVDKALAQYKVVPTEDPMVACLISPPGRTNVVVHAATTEEIVTHAPGTVGGDEFPGGAKKVAEVALAPGVTFYEVETIAPGKDSGTRFHLFFWDGASWKMMGSAWRGM